MTELYQNDKILTRKKKRVIFIKTQKELEVLKKEYENYEGKIIVYYYIAYDGGHSDNDSLETHPVIWLNYNEVHDKLTYESDKDLWNNIKDVIK